MRKSPSLLSASLFGQVNQAVLVATILHPNRAWYLSELASHLKVRPSTLQRTLSKLCRAGILVRQASGNRLYYRVDEACPILPELAGILTKTTGIAEPLREALRPLAGRITAAFIHGSMAEGRERSESDIDLIIIGDAPSSEVALALRPLQQRLGREVNAARYTCKEFADKVGRGHHFLTSVLKKPRIFVIGDEHELEQVAGRQAGGPRADQQAGTR